ncbi:DUF547 domain-containing protein [Neolewinella agarilytica]|uniref:DUF547 domain-containing protein n=1 Tax=Neolewinella agarilytica TaxID=478744 RepID=A0A1H9NPI2_9BACT|nr:DUF547 domain-containing protein [Neolewinella agarilytica]SER37866.1 Protein of unknown function, DUF547 [Neolewinella agarilytica]
MKTNHILVPFLFLLMVFSCGRYKASDSFPPEGYNGPTPIELSQEILRTLKAGQDATPLVDQLAVFEPQDLVAALDTRNKQLAFWVNTYNGMVQYLLTRNPELFDDSSSFFSTPSYTVAGHTFSPNEMEHGIIRGGENRFGLGFIPQFFPNKTERTFKIKGGDSRVHFALNCGAADCPPVEIYRPESFDAQVNNRVRKYLEKHSEINEVDGKSVITTTPLFSWFRGDFRDHDGIDDFLVEYGILTEENKNIKREYKSYDWTLKTGIWAEDTI